MPNGIFMIIQIDRKVKYNQNGCQKQNTDLSSQVKIKIVNVLNKIFSYSNQSLILK